LEIELVQNEDRSPVVLLVKLFLYFLAYLHLMIKRYELEVLKWSNNSQI